MAFSKNVTEASKVKYNAIVDNEKSFVGWDKIQVACFQRMATAMETIAENTSFLQHKLAEKDMELAAEEELRKYWTEQYHKMRKQNTVLKRKLTIANKKVKNI